jgi:glycosyltransferase involved in cell wall biosynthesis
MPRQSLAIVLSGFPRRSETFALAELNALDERGMVAAIFSTKPGEEGLQQPLAARLQRRVHRLAPGDAAVQAEEAAQALDGTRVSGVHAYFAHTPAAVGAELGRLLRVPCGFSAHARDARKVPRAELHDRARRSACVVACNADVAREFDGSGARVHVVPHGVDLERFAPRTHLPSTVFRLLAVGRLVEKKGFDVLLAAAATLQLPWHLRIIGDGPERDRLVEQAKVLGVAPRVTFCGAMTHDALPVEYSWADAVVVPSVRDRSGDRDGLPNVVLEAMASGAAIVATDAGDIRSAIHNGITGLIVAAGDSSALADRMNLLAHEVRLRAALGARARTTAEAHFDVVRCTERLASVLEAAYA